MPHADFAGYLEELVADKVQEVLAPHLETLERLEHFLALGRRGPGRPRGSRSLGRRGRRASPGDASKFHEGQKVRYRQGRGEFDAKVVKTDLKANTVTVERNSDGKRVVRPAAKLYAAG